MVGSEVSVVRFDCDGNTNQYSFLFPITQSSQIKVYAYDTIDHYEALLVEDTHYEITPAIGGYKYGGTINIRSWNAETSSYDPYYFGENVRITIDRSPSVIQVSEYKNNEIVPKEQLESDMDLIYYHLQKLYNFFRHILRSSPSDPTDMVLPPAETRANHPFVFDNLGNPAVGDLIITPVSDYMSQFLQASIWADLESAGLFDNIVTYQTKKTGFTDPTTGFTTDATSQVIFLEVISSLRTVSLRWTDLWLLTSLDYYSIERSSLNSESGYEEIVRLGPGTTTYTDSPPMDFSGEYLLPTTFWYRVKAVNRAGELSPHSNVLEVLIEPITVADVDSNYVLDALQGTQGTGVLPSMAVLQSYNYIYRHLGFQITGTGNAEFNDVFLRGVIEAVAGGIIGGWTITDTGLEAGSELTRLVIDTEDGIYFGGETPDSAPFHVNRYGYAKFQDVFMRGVIEATSGIIGGWAITEAGLSAGLTTINADGSIVIGGNFSVSPEGLVTASDAVISGVISADSGLIGGWNITNSGLSSGSGGSKIVLDPQEGIWFGSENWETAPFAVNRNGFLKANFMELTAPLIQTSWNPTVNRIIFDQSGLRGYDGELGITFELPTDGSAPRFSNGIIEYGTIRQTDIISDYFKTSETLPWVEMTRDGVGFRKSEPAGAYGTGPEYGDGTKYGVGVSAYFGNAAYPPLYIAQELSLADIRFYNRASDPTGPSVIGDIAVVDGVLKICTSPGEPGIYSEIRSDLGTASLVDTGTGAGEVPLNSDLPVLGTASLVDTGTGAGEVPLNSDLDWSADITVTVGSGGDYATINAALAALVKRKPLYDNSGITATINLLAGFVMAEQVLVYGLDLGWITIVGADTETVITHTALTTDFAGPEYGYEGYPAFGVSRGGTLPRVGQLFRFNLSGVGGEKHGVMAIGAGSSADVLDGCGVKDAGTYGILADKGSTINARGADASGAGLYGIYADHGSIINAAGADASGAGNRGIVADQGSTINAESANASGAGTDGIFAGHGSTINANGADASGAGAYGIRGYKGSTINASGATGTLYQTANTLTSNGIIFR